MSLAIPLASNRNIVLDIVKLSPFTGFSIKYSAIYSDRCLSFSTSRAVAKWPNSSDRSPGQSRQADQMQSVY